MDGGSKQKAKPKPHGNPYPKRGGVIKQIIKDWTGGGGGGNDSGNSGGGDAGSSGSAAAGFYGAD